MIALLLPHTGDHVAQHAAPIAAASLFFRRLMRLPWRKQAVPADFPSAGAATPPPGRYDCCAHCLDGCPCDPRDSHPKPCSDGCNSAVRSFTLSAAMDTAEFAVLDEKFEALYRPVNGVYLGTQPRRQPVPDAVRERHDGPAPEVLQRVLDRLKVYGEAPVAEVLEAAEQQAQGLIA